MPFTKGTVPDRLKGKGIPQKYVDIFIGVFNDVLDRTGDEGAAYRQAHGVMNKNLRKDGYRQGKDGRWHKYKKGKEADEPEFMDYMLAKIIPDSFIDKVLITESGGEETPEQQLQRHLDEGMKFIGVALRDDTISQQGSPFERWYGARFNDLCLENTLSWMEMGNTPTIFNRHDSAGGGFFSTSTENPIGKVTRLWREGEEIRYEGFVSPTEKGKEVIRLVHDGVMQPTSVRIYEWLDREEIFQHDDEEYSLQVMEDGRIGGIDFCEQPGIPGAGLVQVMESKDEEVAMAEEEMTAAKLQELYPTLVAEWCAPLQAKIAELEASIAQQATETRTLLEGVEQVKAQNIVLESGLKRFQAACPPAVLAVVEALAEIPEEEWAVRIPPLRVKAAMEVLGKSQPSTGKGNGAARDMPDVGDVRPQPLPQEFQGLGTEIAKMVGFLH